MAAVEQAQTIKIRTLDGDFDIEAVVYGQVAVHLMSIGYRDGELLLSSKYTVSHVSSGYRILAYLSADEAHALARDLQEAGIDFDEYMRCFWEGEHSPVPEQLRPILKKYTIVL